MMKLGDIKETTKKFTAWGYSIKSVWLTKWMPTGEYQVLGLCWGEDKKSHGWCTLYSCKSLKEARAYAKAC